MVLRKKSKGLYALPSHPVRPPWPRWRRASEFPTGHASSRAGRLVGWEERGRGIERERNEVGEREKRSERAGGGKASVLDERGERRHYEPASPHPLRRADHPPRMRTVRVSADKAISTERECVCVWSNERAAMLDG